MLYPNNIKKTINNEISYKNRGMTLEYLIEKANIYYRDKDLAYIYKKPTPIKIVKTSYSKNGKRITDAFFEQPSTLDFNGIYEGRYIEFDAKETKNKTSFPLHNISPHQITHIRNILKSKGIVFLIIYMNDYYYILKGYDLINFIDNEKRKSIPYEYIKTKGINIKLTLNGLDYLSKIDLKENSI